ncbi:MAG TPA: transcriptional repressor NrdR [Firmicutes bacterium]|nr:transcriptional repressor NrdR [Bacillota bacterium]
MRCPFCHHRDSKVVDSRSSEEGVAIRRRRECLACERRFTTYERIEEEPLIIIKKDGRREPFNREKILNGLRKACEKRPLSVEALEKITDEVEQAVRKRNENETPSTVIGELIMERLKEIDEVAYVRFASVYRQFKDLDIFMRELQNLLGDRKSWNRG